MGIKNKSQCVIGEDGAGLKSRNSIFWLKIGKKTLKTGQIYGNQYKRSLSISIETSCFMILFYLNYNGVT